MDPLAAIAGTVLLTAWIVGGGVTAAKGRWGWLLGGLVALGAIWPFTALLTARPESPWAQAFYTPDKMAKARRRFPRTRP